MQETADHDAAVGAVGAGGEVGNAERVAGGAHDCFRRRHAVDEAPDFELGLEFVGDEVEDDICVADRVLYGGDEVDSVAEGSERCFRMAQVGGHHVFKRDLEAGRGAGECEGAASGARAYDRDVRFRVEGHVTWRWS